MEIEKKSKPTVKLSEFKISRSFLSGGRNNMIVRKSYLDLNKDIRKFNKGELDAKTINEKFRKISKMEARRR